MFQVPRIRKGGVIRADYLNNIGDIANSVLETAVTPPYQQNAPAPAEQQNQDPTTEATNSFIEVERAVSTVQVFDQNDENYAEVTRIESVTLQNAQGESMTLVFNN